MPPLFLTVIRDVFSTTKYPAPGGNMMSIRKMVSLASSHSKRFEEHDDLSDLDSALQYNTTVVQAAKIAGHHSLPHYYETLAMFHSMRFDRKGDRGDMESSFQYIQAAIDSTSAGDSALPRRYESLAVAYATRFRQMGNLDDLEAALKHHHIAVDTTPVGDPDLLVRKTNLGVLYFDRFQRLGNRSDLDASLQYDLSVMEAVASDDPELPHYQQSLATSYGTRFQFFGDLEDLKLAVKYNQAAVDGTPPDDPACPHRQQNLALCLTILFEQVGDLGDLELAVEYGKAALELTSEGDIELPTRQQSLAMSYSVLFTRHGNLEDLEKSIHLKKISVDATPMDHPKLASRHKNLAFSFSDRFHRLEDINDLELALKYNRAAVSSTPPDNPDLPEYQNSLAMSHFIRYQSLHDLGDLNQAIHYSEASVKATLPNHPDWAWRLNSLALCHEERFKKFHQLEDLQHGLELKQLVVDSTPIHHPDITAYYFSLGHTYWDYFQSQNRLEHLESSMEYYQKAVDSTPEDHAHLPKFQQRLAEVLGTYYQRVGNKEALHAALSYYQKSTQSPFVISATLWNAARQWGSLALQNDLPVCLEAYSIALGSLSQLIWMGNSMSVRHDTLIKYEIPTVAGVSATAAIKFGKPEKAVEFLEQGLAVTYRQLHQLKDEFAILAERSPNLADRLKQISLHLQGVENQLFSTNTHNYHLLALERKALIERIRTLDGFQDLFLPPSYHDLSIAAKEGPVIMINCTDLRSDAIIILSPHAPVETVVLSNVTPAVVAKKLEVLRSALELCQIKSRSRDQDRYGIKFQGSPQLSSKYFQDVLSWLWHFVVNPVFKVLYKNGISSGRIWWCPSGPFTYLPLHAAGFEKNNFVQSYTSTLSALIQGRLKVSNDKVREMKVTMLGVTELPNQPHLSLPSVKRELAQISNIVGGHRILQLQNEDATKKAGLEHITAATWLHLACHGQQNITQPLHSGLLLQDGILELGQILDISLPAAEFAFLSACQTAMGDSNLMNESMHLVGGLVAAGFKGAVGTLWSMADSDGPLVAEIFYKRILEEGEDLDVSLAAEALNLAVKKLQQSGASFQRWVPFVHFGV